MLNIFADALMIAARVGRPLEDQPSRRDLRRSLREFLEIEGLNTSDRLRNLGR